jgi:hypothetical protein
MAVSFIDSNHDCPFANRILGNFSQTKVEDCQRTTFQQYTEQYPLLSHIGILSFIQKIYI